MQDKIMPLLKCLFRLRVIVLNETASIYLESERMFPCYVIEASLEIRL